MKLKNPISEKKARKLEAIINDERKTPHKRISAAFKLGKYGGYEIGIEAIAKEADGTGNIFPESEWGKCRRDLKQALEPTIWDENEDINERIAAAEELGDTFGFVAAYMDNKAMGGGSEV